MASLRKFPGSPYWYGCFTLPSGKRVQRSTKKSTRKEAQAVADKWEKVSQSQLSAKQAHSVIAEIYRDANGEELPKSTPRAFIAEWLIRRKNELAPSSLQAYRGRSDDFLKWLGKRADEYIGAVMKKDFVAYRDKLSKEVSPQTTNHGIKLLRVIFEDARRDGYVEENAATDVPLLKNAKSIKRRAFTVAELQTVLKHADDEWRSMILFGLYTGQRLGDLATLRWSNVDSENGELRLETGKTGRVVIIPLAAPLKRHIEGLKGKRLPVEFIHPSIAAIAHRGSTASNQFADILAKAGLRKKVLHAKKSGEDATRTESALSFHSLRHTAVTLMKNAGASPSVVQDLIGHESAAVSRLYTHTDTASKRKALNKIPDLEK